MECKRLAKLGRWRTRQLQGGFRKQIEALLWTETRTRGGGRNKSQGGIQQQDVVRSGSPIKWSTPLPLMATVKTQHVREERWRETTRMMVLQQGEQTGDYWKWTIWNSRPHRNTEVQQPWRSTHKSERQVLMQYMKKAAHRRSISWRTVICNICVKWWLKYRP